ncbi:MAG: aldehyde:ferredoxin oxidoreductase [Deltaproteobacteria bacterium]|nr:aldehyde:ferredoxin oxidoreductase [Deltaproteobacteria bacterium]
MSKLYGYAGIRLRVDLSDGKIRKEEISASYARKWMGGRGFNMEVLAREVPVDADPRGPENLLVFGVGPITGTGFPGSRINVSGKSPHTGFLGDSNAGGHFGAEMKFAGYDQIVIEGKAERPVWLRIVDGGVEIRDASHLWHLDTWETQAAIQRECRDHMVQVACCGTGAVNGVSFGCVMTNNARAMARTGMGTLMASKNLKAVALTGTGGVQVSDPEKFQSLVHYVFRALYHHPNFQERGVTGTTNLIRLCNDAGILPTRHFQTGIFEHWLEVSGETVAAKYNVKRKACFGCINPCSRFYLVPEGFDGRELKGEGPEYETLAGFTARVGNPDLKVALKCAELVNRAGIDSITASEVISWAQEMYQLGFIRPADCDGLDLSWGNSRAVYELLLKIIRNEGFGAVLSQGVVHAAETLGFGRELCMEAKNLEIFQADVRGLKAYGLGNAVASRGADHQRADPFFELSGRVEEARERFGSENCALMLPWEGKGKMVPWFEEMCALADSLSFCKIIGVSMEVIREAVARDLFRFSTGFDVDIEEVLRIGERINNLERTILVRYGLSRKDDILPGRFTDEPLPEDSNLAAGGVFENRELLSEYYSFRGWDPDTGWPTEKKLQELGLDFMVQDLKKRGIRLKSDYPTFDGDLHGTTSLRWSSLSVELGPGSEYMNRFPVKKKEEGRDEAMDRVEKIPKRLVIDPALCTGCRACEMACSYVHEKVYSPSLSRIRVVKLEEAGVDRPIICLRCAKAPCKTACPEEAILQDPLTRVVRVMEERCVGCGLCTEACVNGVLQLHPREGYPLMCDLCGGDPDCVKKCPTGALTFVEGTNHAAKKTREEIGRMTEKQLRRKWSREGTRPVDTPMRPPDPETGEPIEPPEIYGGDPPPPFGRKERREKTLSD